MRLLTTTRIEPITSKTLRMRNAMSSQSTSNGALPEYGRRTASDAAHPTAQTPHAIDPSAMRVVAREYGISFLQPMFRIWSIRTRRTDHEIQMNTRDTRSTLRRNHASSGPFVTGTLPTETIVKTGRVQLS